MADLDVKAVRRIASKTIQCAEAGERAIEVAAAALSCAANPVDIVAAAYTADGTRTLDDLNELLDANPMFMGMIALDMRAERIAGVWRLVKAVGVDLAARPPKNEFGAAKSLVEGIVALTDEQKHLLGVASDLTKP